MEVGLLKVALCVDVHGEVLRKVEPSDIGHSADFWHASAERVNENACETCCHVFEHRLISS